MFVEKNNLSKKEQIVPEGIMDGQKMKDITGRGITYKSTGMKAWSCKKSDLGYL